MVLFSLCLSLSAGLLRQATYTTTRLGIYTILFEKMTGADGRPPSFLLKVLATPFTQLLVVSNVSGLELRLALQLLSVKTGELLV